MDVVCQWSTWSLELVFFDSKKQKQKSSDGSNVKFYIGDFHSENVLICLDFIDLSTYHGDFISHRYKWRFTQNSGRIITPISMVSFLVLYSYWVVSDFGVHGFSFATDVLGTH